MKENELALARTLSNVALALTQTQRHMNEVEQTIFGWLASAKLGSAIPGELHKLDLAVQAVGEIAKFLEALVKELPEDLAVDAANAIDAVSLADLRLRLDPRLPDQIDLSPGAGHGRGIEIF